VATLTRSGPSGKHSGLAVKSGPSQRAVSWRENWSSTTTEYALAIP
jgi:hypothetical protein